MQVKNQDVIESSHAFACQYATSRLFRIAYLTQTTYNHKPDCANTLKLMTSWTDFPELRTPRLILREIVAHDLPQIYCGLSNPAISYYYGVSYSSLAATQAQLDYYQREFIEGTALWWGLALHEKPDELIGSCGLHGLVAEHYQSEIGFWILPDYAGQGYMNEAVQAIVAYSFQQLKLHRLQALVDTGNHACLKLLRAQQFECEGVMRDAEYKAGRFHDLFCLALLNPAK